MNLRDSGVKDVAVALRKGSSSIKKAKAEKLTVMAPSEAAKWADIVMVLSPDEGHAALYKDDLEGNLKKGAALAFAHGLSIHFKLIEPLRDTRAASGSELYQLASDPDEQRNLYGTPEFADVQRRLEDALAAWRSRTVN